MDKDDLIKDDLIELILNTDINALQQTMNKVLDDTDIIIYNDIWDLMQEIIDNEYIIDSSLSLREDEEKVKEELEESVKDYFDDNNIDEDAEFVISVNDEKYINCQNRKELADAVIKLTGNKLNELVEKLESL